jgi:amino acid adenylation domain-containing protein
VIFCSGATPERLRDSFVDIKNILADLRQRNILVRLKGDDLAVVAEKGALSPEIKAMLASHKQALLSYFRRLEQTEASEIQVVDRSSRLPLSSGQQRLWFLTQLEPASSAYVVPAAVRIAGPLQPELLSLAFEKIADRHEVLRTVFKTENGEPRQVILSKMAVPLSLIDLRHDSPADQQARLEECIRCEIDKPFDLSAGPLLRGVILQLGEQEYVLFLALHHIVSDGWSIPILVRELSAFYAAASPNGKPADLPALPVQYADYAAWQHRWKESAARGRQLAYWERQLAGLVPLILPADHPRNDHGSPRGATAVFEIPAALTSRMKLLGLQEEATPFMVFLAAFKVLLGRYSGQNQIAVGTPVANREMREIAGLIGFFVNTLVLFTNADQASSFRDFLRQVRKTMLDALENQGLPFEQLVDHLQPERTLNQNPLFQVMFILENTPRGDMRLGGVTLQPFPIETLTAKFDVTLSLTPEEDRLLGRLNYNRELFDPATIQRMIAHYLVLLEGIAGQPDQSLAELPLLTEAERRQLLVEWNRTAVEYPQKTVIELFELHVDKAPEAIAVRYADQRLSYAELNERANHLAHYLQELGVEAEVRVGLCMERSVEMIVGLLGILKAGGAYVPLDPAYPQERLAYMLRDSQTGIVLTEERLKDKLRSLAPEEVRFISLDGQWAEMNARVAGLRIKKAQLRQRIRPHHLAYVIYTSGSTGKPKGVMVEHGGLCNLAMAQAAFNVNADSRCLQFASLSFDASIFEIAMALCHGGELHLIMQEESMSGESLARLIQQQGITHATLTPAVLVALPEKLDLKPVKTLVVAGEAVTSALVKRWAAGRRMFNAYGPTEATVWASLYLCDAEEEGNPPIGRSIPNIQIYILDQWGNPVPVGVAGELHIGGAGVARGYLNCPELTQRKFVANPFMPGTRIYKTGDLARWLEDGNIQYLGRTDAQVKVRGFRIELDEIETQLNQHPGIQESAVIAHGQEAGKQLVAFYRAKETTTGRLAEVPYEELRGHLLRTLPDYMVPAAFVSLAAIPLTPNGKADRAALARMEVAISSGQEYVPPRNERERQLVNIWAEILKLAEEKIGVNDNFFKLGGHSLLVTQVVSRVRKEFSVELSVRALFETPTIAGLARRIDDARLGATQETIPALRRVERRQPAPLSFAQQRLWFIDQLEPGSAVYNVPLALRIEGQLNRKALQWALQEIVNRHEVLRTRFPQQGGVPVQQIEAEVEIRIEEIDLAGMDKAGREEAAAGKAGEEAGISFDLAQGPLVRVKLVRLGEEDHVLLVTMHHIVSDGWSTGIMLKEFSHLYEAGCRGEESGLPELPVQYADFSIWQREWLRGAVLERELEYWKQRLGGVQALEFPADHGRPAVVSHAGGNSGFKVGRELLWELKKLGREQGTTLYMTCLAAWQALLYRYTGQEDIAVGSPIAGRRWAETEELIGFFVNTLVLRSEVSGEGRFSDLLRQVRETTLEAYAHQDVPFEKVVEEVEPERDLGHTPLFQVMFTLQSSPFVEMRVGGIRLTPFPVESETAKFDLALTLTEEKEELAGWLSYRRDLFEAGSMERIIRHYCMLLGGMVERREEKIGDMPLLEEGERRQLLVEWNRKEVEYPGETLVEMFERQAGKTPRAVAVSYEERQLSYAELNERTNQMGHYLRKLGVGPEMRVGICLERGLEMVVALLGVLKAGAAYVPMDPGYPRERLQFMAEDAQVAVLISQRSPEIRLSENQAGILFLEDVCLEIEQCSREKVESGVEVGNLAYLIYTSGSTGKPKGVMVTHGNVVRLMRATENWFGFNERDVWTMFHSYAFDFSVWELWGALLYGGRLELVPYWVSRSAEEFYRLVKQRGVTVLNQTPSAFQQFSRQDASNCQGGEELKLRLVIFGGEALEMSSLRPWFERHEEEKPRMVNMYGITETTVHVTLKALTRQAAQGNASMIGKRIPDLQLYILREMQPVPVGVAGEMYVGGAGLARGYWNRADLTAERFVPHLFSEDGGERLYRTGDLGRYLADGGIEYLGRIDQQVKIRGHRIELGEIEVALRQHPAVAQTAVIVRGDQPAEKRLAAYVVRNENSMEDGGRALREYLRSRLPEYMVPAAIMELESLPLTSNGKLDRRALARIVPAENRDETTYVAPRTPFEEVLANSWAELLRVERVGIHDNFFELGGHSLLVTQVVSRVRKEFSVELSVRALFETPTIAGLARRIDDARLGATQETIPALRRVERRQPAPLSFAQQRLWFIDQLEPGSAVYNVPLALRIEGQLNRKALQWALQEIVNRHEVLRTRFPQQGGVPVQQIEAEVEIRIEEIDLAGMDKAGREEAAAGKAGEEAGISFDLAQGPLVRVKLVRLGEEDHVLLVTMHHIVSDGWSTGIMLKEFSHLYEAGCRGEESGLPELPVQYADFSIWQREWLRGAVLERELEYWKQRLGGVQALEFPADHGRPAVVSHAGGNSGFKVGRELLWELKKLGREQGTTLYMTCLAAWQALLYRYTGQEDIAVGSPIAGRRWAETEELIGFFVNTLVLRSEVSGEGRFSDLLRQVRETTLEAYAHQDVPFEKVVEEVEPERDLGHTPLFQVMFTLQSSPFVEMRVGGIRLTPFPVESETAKFDLALTLTEEKEELAGWLSYRRDLFEAGSMERIIRHYCMLLGGMVERREEKIGDMPLLEEGERRQLLVEWNRKEVEYPGETLVEMFERQAGKTPRAVAVSYEERQLSYAELNERTNQMGHYLRKLGVGPEMRVGICLERGLEMVVALLGVLKAGAAYVPMDPGYPRERLQFMAEDAQVAVLISQRSPEIRLSENQAGILFLEDVCLEIEQCSREKVESGVEVGNLAYLIYTSGSTGKPKGVMVTHGNVVRLMRATENWFGFNERDVWTMFHSYAFDFSVWELWGALLYGGRLELVPYWVSRSAEEFYRLVKQRGVTVLNQTPSAFQQFSRQDASNCQGGEELKLRLVIFGGEALEMSSLRPWFERHEEEKPRMVNMYGITETTVHVTLKALTRQAAQGNASMIGKRIPDLQLYILREMQPVPVGVAGEMYVGGAGLARGYWNRADLTAERFVPHLFSEDGGERLYRTGDLGRYLADGGIEYLGRIDQQVKIRGHRIELGEIEAALEKHEAVKRAIVMAREDQPAEKRLVAYVVREQTGEELDVSRMRSYLQTRLPDYMLPAALVVLENIPLTAHGKLDRKALPRPEWKLDEKKYMAPTSAVEKELSLIWAEILGVERVGIQDNFFELGGHSLLALQLTSRIKSAFAMQMPVSALFKAPTVARMAEYIESVNGQKRPQSSSILVGIQPHGSLAPFFCVHAIGGQVLCYLELAKNLGPERPFYGLQSPPANESGIAMSIEEMARLYCQEILHVQSEGPYLLGGWSMGGWIAFEMARQLKLSGKTVSLLALFDSYPPAGAGVGANGNEERRFSMLARFAADLSQSLGKDLTGLEERFLRSEPQQQWALLLETLVNDGFLPQDGAEILLKELLNIFTRNSAAIDNYLPVPQEQSTVLFQAADNHAAPGYDPQQWAALTGASLEIHKVPGDHYTLLRAPHVLLIADVLRRRVAGVSGASMTTPALNREYAISAGE